MKHDEGAGKVAGGTPVENLYSSQVLLRGRKIMHVTQIPLGINTEIIAESTSTVRYIVLLQVCRGCQPEIQL